MMSLIACCHWIAAMIVSASIAAGTCAYQQSEAWSRVAVWLPKPWGRCSARRLARAVAADWKSAPRPEWTRLWKRARAEWFACGGDGILTVMIAADGAVWNGRKQRK